MNSDLQNTSGNTKIKGKLSLEMTAISKSFGPVQALQNVDFQLKIGEVMALVGENGAGKSTLVKILAGIYRPDSGEFRIAGKKAHIRGTADSQVAGIAVVQQELSLIPTMSAAENIFLGNQSLSVLFTPGKLEDMASPYLELVGLEYLDPSITVNRLSIAEQQLIEVARMVSRKADILVLDEPTAALNDSEIEKVKCVVRSLVKKGKSVIYVTHRLPEVFDLADRVTILRNGKSKLCIPVSELTTETLIEHMIGRSLKKMFPLKTTEFGSEVFAVHNLCTKGIKTPINLSIRSGEILGLAGQIGSGVSGLLQAIAGVQPITSGTVELKQKTLNIRGRQDAISTGISYCSSDRKKDGIFSVRTITENLTSPALDKITPHGWLNKRKEKNLSTSLAQFFMIDVKRLGHLASTLSGGNQQKVALGKWLGIKTVILLVEEPTRGVDVGARAEIYTNLRQMANEGLAVIFASSDIQEVLGLADTIASFYHGRLINIKGAEETDLNRLTMDVTSPSEKVELESEKSD